MSEEIAQIMDKLLNDEPFTKEEIDKVSLYWYERLEEARTC